MKILVVTEVYRPGIGGIQTAVDTLIGGLIAKGDEVTVMTGSPKGPFCCTYQEIDDINGATVMRLPALKSFVNKENNRLTLFPNHIVRRYFYQYHPDIIHLLIPSTWLHASVLRQAQRYHIPVIATGHSIVLNLEMNMKYKRLARWIGQRAEKYTVRQLNRTNFVTAPTQTALDYVSGITVPTLPISNGVDIKIGKPDKESVRTKVIKRFGLDSKKKTVIYVGRLDGEKRVDLLINAMHALDRRDTQLVIVGKGLEMESLKDQVAQLGLDDSCIFTGYVTDSEKRILLQQADIFAIASPAELQCIAALEAMLCKTPVVVADQVALPELLDGDRNGFSFSYPDSQDLAAKINILLDDGKLRQRMSHHAQQWVMRYHSHEHTIIQYRTIYRKLIDDMSQIEKTQ